MVVVLINKAYLYFTATYQKSEVKGISRKGRLLRVLVSMADGKRDFFAYSLANSVGIILTPNIKSDQPCMHK